MSGYSVNRTGKIITVENSAYSESFSSHLIRCVALSHLMKRVEIMLAGEKEAHHFGEYNPETLVALRDAIVSAWNESLQEDAGAAVHPHVA